MNTTQIRMRIIELCGLIIAGKDSPELLDALGELGILIYTFGMHTEGNDADAAIKR